MKRSQRSTRVKKPKSKSKQTPDKPVPRKRKIFVIGFNKTGTITFHKLFSQNGLKSQHKSKLWEDEKFDCFSDGGDYKPFKEYFNKYPDSVFILNTRQLDKWIISRCKHCIETGQTWFYPFTTELFTDTVNRRQTHFLDVMDFFKTNPSRLLIVDISKPRWIQFVCKKFNLKYFNIYAYKRPDKRVDQTKLKNAYDVLNKTSKKLGLSDTDKSCNFIVESLLSPQEKQLYRELVSIYKKSGQTNFL